MGTLDHLLPIVAPQPERIYPPLGSLVAPANTRPMAWQLASEAPTSAIGRIREPVTDSEDLQRILKIPRRAPLNIEQDKVRAEALIDMMTAHLTRPIQLPCQCAALGRECITRLKAAQAWALYEAQQTQGILGAIGVGHGKTGLDILSPLVMPDCKLAVLLIPPGLRQQLLRDYQAWSQHFRVPSLVMDEKGFIVPGAPVLHVVPFSKFSRASSTDILETLRPDTIIVDEADKLRHTDTATTSRVLRYCAAHPECRRLDWSGTLTDSSIKDYAHLAAFSLGENSPLPLHRPTLDQWALAIDPSDWPSPMGALSLLCRSGEHLYEAFNRRLVETRGVIATKASAIDAKIVIAERKAPEMPERLRQMLHTLRDKDAPGGWTRPDGEELIDILSVNACARQLACGFFYRWIFPRQEPAELIEAWFAARKNWHKELREKLRKRIEHLDSPLLCTKAAIRAYQDPPYEGDLPIWRSDFWPAWRDIRASVYHETEAVWVDQYLAADAADWGQRNRGVVWYEYEAFGSAVARLSGLPQHGGGPDAEAAILAETGERSIVASINAHGRGRDGLQRLFFQQLITSVPPSGARCEQLLGRLHRIGQKSPIVRAEVYRHTEEMAEVIDKAILKARYIQGTMGTLQKLLSADVQFRLRKPRKDEDLETDEE